MGNDRNSGKTRDTTAEKLKKVKTATKQITDKTVNNNNDTTFYIPFFYRNLSSPYREGIKSFFAKNVSTQAIYERHLSSFRKNQSAVFRKFNRKGEFSGRETLDRLYAMLNNKQLIQQVDKQAQSVLKDTINNFNDAFNKGPGKIANDVTTMQKMVQQIDIIAEKLFDMFGNKNLYKAYQLKYFNQYISSNGSVKAQTKVAEKILDDIMSSPQDGKKWTGVSLQNFNDAGIDESLKSLAIMAEAIKTITRNSGSGSSKFYNTGGKHFVSRSGKKTQEFTDDDMAGRLAQHFCGVLLNYAKDLSESIATEFEKAAIDRWLKKNGYIKKKIVASYDVQDTGKKYLNNMSFSGKTLLEVTAEATGADPMDDLEEFIDQLKDGLVKRGWVKDGLRSMKQKSDSTMYFNLKNGEKAQIGVTVKDYSGITVGDGKTPWKDSNIKLQDGTPFATALLKYTGISRNGFYGVIALGAGYAGDDIPSSPGWLKERYEGKTYLKTKDILDDEWNQMLEILKARMFLIALAGPLQENILFMRLGKRYFKIEDIISNVSRTNGEKLTLRSSEGATKLSRDFFHEENQWVEDSQTSNSGKKIRSQRAYKGILNKMYLTTLRMEINSAMLHSV